MNSVMKLILHMYVVLTDLREVLIYPKNDFVTEKTSVDLPMVENLKPTIGQCYPTISPLWLSFRL